MTVAERRRQAERLAARCHAGQDLATLREEVLRGLRGVMTVDAAFFATVDPATLLFTTAVAEEPLDTVTRQFLENEYGRADVNKFAILATTSDPVRTLDQATSGRRHGSDRYVDVMAPLQLGDELRAALVTGGRCWGVLCLHRTDTAAGFSMEEVAFVRRLAPHIAEGLRRALVTGGMAPPQALTRGPGIILVADDMTVMSVNEAAERWIAELCDPAWIDIGTGPLPAAVFAAVAAADTVAPEGSPPPTIRLRSIGGQWITVSASRLRGAAGGQTAVVLEGTHPADVASIHLDALGLTAAQTRVAALVLQGRSTHQIVTELRISSHTVQEHLHAVFDKLGVGSRRELVAQLLGAHH